MAAVLLIVLAVVATVPAAALGAGPSPVPTALAVHAPILISSDAGFTAAQGVVSGSGTEAEPYVLEDWDITPSGGPGIEITGTTAYFVIQGVAVHDGTMAYEGIVLTELSHGVVRSSTVARNQDAVRLYHATDVRIEANTFDANYLELQVDDCTDVSITANTISGGSLLTGSYSTGIAFEWNVVPSISQGILAWGMQDARVTNNTFGTSNAWALRLSGWTRYDLSNNSFASAAGTAIELTTSSHGRVVDNQLAVGADPGIHLSGDQDVLVARNVVSGGPGDGLLVDTPTSGMVVQAADVRILGNDFPGGRAGLRLVNVHRATVSGNTFSGTGIVLEGTELVDYASHTIPDGNAVDGRPILYRHDVRGFSLDRVDVGQVLLANLTDVRLANLTFPAGETPVQAASVRGLVVDNVTAEGSWGDDLALRWVTNGSLSGVVARAAAGAGLRLVTATNVTLTNVTLESDDTGVSAEVTTAFTLQGSRLLGDRVGANLQSSTGPQVLGNTFTDDRTGLQLGVTSGGLVDGNEFLGNGIDGVRGLDFTNPSHVTVSRNNITGYALGLSFVSTYSAAVFHNNFLANGQEASDVGGSGNTWDHGYPSGGNYWATYAGADACSGAAQDVCPDADGIGDTPMAVGAAADRYPLVRPYGSPPLPPLADFTINPNPVQPTVAFTVDAGPSTDPDGVDAALVVRWDWEGDGLWDTAWSTVHVATHTFATVGDRSVGLEVRDGSGLTATATHVVSVSGEPPPDTTPPQTAAALAGTSGAAGWYVSNVTVTLTATDDRSGVAAVAYRIDGGPWTVYAGLFEVGGDGAHALDYNATDVAGNAEATHTARFSIDTRPPETSATAEGTPGDGSWYVSDVTVTLAAADATSGVASVSYRVDGGTSQPYAGPFLLGDGVHTISARAADVAGNSGPWQDLSVRVDRAPPVLQMTWPAALVASPTVSLAWNATDIVSGVREVRLSVDGAVATSFGAAGTEVLDLADGPHTLAVEAIDAAGNRAAESFELLVDATDPVLNVAALPSTVTTAAVTVSWSGEDATSGIARYEVRVDDGPRRDVGLDTSFAASLPDGAHTVRVWAFDAAGNNATASVTFRIDTNPFSPSGPYAGLPTYALAAGVAAAGVAYALLRRGRRASSNPPTLPSEAPDRK